ncbi:integrin alpha-PS2 isoform X2 [Chironomus tepperi]|uniref:integrin alpha-PS2 isoform X2 n=1 Tax=Chironomus tepperi TaxID=113505 RepID=UPI00391FC384
MNSRIIGLLIRPLLLLLLLVNNISTFNLDVANYISHEGQDGSMFGFSVALHQEQRSWVIIGAPKADTSKFQPGVYNAGAVYRCDISDDNRCQIIHFDSNGNNYNERNEQIDTKSNQWFGASVSSTGINGPLVACAPRYVYHQHQPKKVERNEPVGTCFIAKDNFREFKEFSPCRTMYWGYHRQGSCQAGLSAAISKDGERLFVGAPGSWYWQGQMYSYSLNNPKDKVYSTKESSSKEDDSYLGYSSATGDFMGEGLQGVAVGMPRGAGLLGKVLIFSWNLTNQVNITGEQIGAYFGYSICTVDVDGDGLQDLIIGAPMYTEPNKDNKYETGIVYIVYQSKVDNFKNLETREGKASKGRFGLALASLGDINLDGYGDFAVGAPYDGPNERGVVYIYHGSANGPLKKPSQVIASEDVTGTPRPLTTFGFSLAGGIDLDGNQYPDLVVGAYESSSAIVFKSRTVAVMDASAVFESENKLISLDNKNCTLSGRDKKQVACTTITSCLSFNGKNVPSVIDIEISWVLDSKKTKTPRMFFVNRESQNIQNTTMRLYRGKSECRSDNVYIADGIRDKLTPLEVEMKYNIRKSTTSYASSEHNRRARAVLETVLDENRGTVQRDSINIMKNCGKDNICIPDLRLDVKTNDKYILGGNESLTVDVLVSNFGEDAFESTFFMTVPQGLDFKSTKKLGESRDTSFICTAPSAMTNYTLRCDIGNPLPAKKSVNFKVILEPSRKAGLSPYYEFYMEANSTNEEAEGGQSDNVYRKQVSISVESDLSITGRSQPDVLHYNVSQYREFSNSSNEADIGPHFVHIYDIRNNGTSTIEEIELFINWPAMTLDKEPLMYLLSQPEISGNVYCEPTQFVNQENLQIDYSLEKKSFLDKNRAPIRSGEGRFTSGAWGSKNRYNTQGQASFEEKQILDKSDSQEVSAGDASLVHENRQKHKGKWQVTQGGSTSNKNREGFGTGVTSHTAHTDRTVTGGGSSGGYESSYFENKTYSSRNQGASGSGSGSGSFAFEKSGSSGSSSSAGNQGGSTIVVDKRGNSGSDLNSFISGSNAHGGAGNNVREYEYHEQWNSSSVNGGPQITHVSKKNQTFVRGEGGRVVLSETSTETIITGGIGHSSWQSGGSSQSDMQGSSHIDSRFGSSHSTAQTQEQQEYERKRVEYYEQQKKIQEEQRRIQIEERRRLDEQRRAEERKRLELHEQRRLDDERRYEEERRQYEEQQKRRVDEQRRKLEEERLRSTSNTQSSSYEASQTRNSGNRQAGGNRSQSSHSSHTSSSSSTGSSSYGSGNVDINLDENVHQDISSLAARTHAQNAQSQSESSSSGAHSGRRRMMSQQDGEPPRPDLVHGVTTFEKAAQGGRGLQTVGVDLGILGGRNNVDDEIRRQSGSSGRFSTSSGNRQSTSGSTGAGSASRGGQSSSSNSNTQFSSGSTSKYLGSSLYNQIKYQDYSYEDDQYGEEEELENDNIDDKTQGNSYSTQHKSSYTYKSSDANPQFKLYRTTRDINNVNSNGLCESAHCVNVRCVVGPLEKNTGAEIALRMRLVAHTLNKLGSEQDIKLSTMAIGKITKLPYVGAPANETLKSHEVFVTAIPDPVPKPDVIPLWIFVLAACAGALILLLLIYLLYKCGFFKRNRPTGSPHERQPLNRNGNYHGDEHL